MSEESLNLQNLCRTCMSTPTPFEEEEEDIKNVGMPKQNIYERPYGRIEGVTIIEILQAIEPQIPIIPEDNLPKSICGKCVEKLDISYEFLQMYKATNEKFAKLLKEIEMVSVSVPIVEEKLIHSAVRKKTVPDFVGSPRKRKNFKNIPDSGIYGTEPIDSAKRRKSVKNILTSVAFEGNPLDSDVERNEDKSSISKLEVIISEGENDLGNDSQPEFEAMFIQNSNPDTAENDATLISDNPFDRTASEEDVDWRPTQAATERLFHKKSKLTKCKTLRTPKNKTRNSKTKQEPPTPPSPTDDGNFNCLECHKVFTNLTLWQEHTVAEHYKSANKRQQKGDTKTFACEICGKVFQRKSIYTTHMLTHTGNFSCLECGKKCRTYASLNKHMLCHKGERFECKKCGKEFSDISDHNNHILTHKDDQPLQCKECGKILKTTLGLRTHLMRHKGEKKYQCPHCPKQFVVRSGLYGHVKQLHEEGKPHLCDICGKGFRLADMLTKHKRYHSERIYRCEFCDKCFVTMDKQRRHMRTHTGEKPFRCKYCDRAYTQSNERNKHMKQHLGENIYQCELCPLRFPMVKDVRAHFVSHKDEDEETRARNLEARALEEKILNLKFGIS